MKTDTLPFWFPFFFIAMWCSVCFLLSQMSGWSTMVQRFRLKRPFVGARKYFQSGMVGWVGYRSCLTVGVGQEGLYLAVLPLFAIGSPPLLIPWTGLSNLRKKKFLWIEDALMDIGHPKITSVRIPWRFIETARPWLGQKLIHG